MRILRTVTSSALIAVAVVSTPAARDRADQPRRREEITVKAVYPEFDREYVVTFSATVVLPGRSLGRGSYIFRRLDSGVIQVLSQDRRETHLVVHTVPTLRANPTGEHVFVLAAGIAADSPPRLVRWFLPGHANGQEMLYPPANAPRANE